MAHSCSDVGIVQKQLNILLVFILFLYFFLSLLTWVFFHSCCVHIPSSLTSSADQLLITFSIFLNLTSSHLWNLLINPIFFFKQNPADYFSIQLVGPFFSPCYFFSSWNLSNSVSPFPRCIILFGLFLSRYEFRLSFYLLSQSIYHFLDSFYS